MRWFNPGAWLWTWYIVTQWAAWLSMLLLIVSFINNLPPIIIIIGQHKKENREMPGRSTHGNKTHISPVFVIWSGSLYLAWGHNFVISLKEHLCLLNLIASLLNVPKPTVGQKRSSECISIRVGSGHVMGLSSIMCNEQSLENGYCFHLILCWGQGFLLWENMEFKRLIESAPKASWTSNSYAKGAPTADPLEIPTGCSYFW